MPDKKKTYSGKNVRIPDEADHEKIASHCQKTGQLLGKFVAQAALDKVKKQQEVKNEN